MLIRISLIVAIVAALAVGAVNFIQVRAKIDALMQQRDSYHTQRDDVQTKLNNTNKVLVQTQGNLRRTEQDLATAKSDREKAVATAAAQQKRADDLASQLAKAAQDREKAAGELEAYTLTGLTAKQVTELSRSLKNAQNTIDAINEEKLLMSRTIERLTYELNKLVGTNAYVVTLPANLKGRILVVDPKWDFVVLDVGDVQGVKEDGELLVSRKGKLVAKVIVRSIQKDRCIANIMPGWKLGQLIEGDDVTPAHPAS
jgi:hypothetical protein